MYVSGDYPKVWSQAVLERAGLPDKDARAVVDSHVAAGLRGMHSHGVVRLPWYVSGVQRGMINPDPDLS